MMMRLWLFWTLIQPLSAIDADKDLLTPDRFIGLSTPAPLASVGPAMVVPSSPVTDPTGRPTMRPVAAPVTNAPLQNTTTDATSRPTLSPTSVPTGLPTGTPTTTTPTSATTTLPTWTAVSEAPSWIVASPTTTSDSSSAPMARPCTEIGTELMDCFASMVNATACDACVSSGLPLSSDTCIELQTSVCDQIVACPCGGCLVRLEQFLACAFDDLFGCRFDCPW